ncbi:hypothetical protein [Flavobacterium sp. UBA4854]|uniref:hypothetical protein n=1 Tax=Flavobacterium sp. UBA4854 TaxID=1946548 RepID=UPI00257AA0DD|nr:hypothetical protein [Flavobacterium sp. UBA4854]
MEKYFSLLFLVFFISCNKIETQSSLNKKDLNFIKSLNLLDKEETIYKFYSENTKETAGNFFTNKRVASYWIDKRKVERNEIVFAFYNDIIKIDTVNYAGITYCPYALITKKDKSTFKVSVDGKKIEVKSFFEDLLFQWKKNSKNI